ncbi:MAG: hypothetical protein V7637_5412 [Mycobacteriales bacterium]|jgi:hypothetical protein
MSRERLDTATYSGQARLARTPRADRWWRELLLAAVLYEIYNLIQASLTGSTARAQRDGQDLLNLERVLHLDPEHVLNQSFGHVTALAVPACYFYATLHFIITPAVLIWAYRARPVAYRQLRSVLAVMTLLGLVGFWWFPTAPPRLLDGAGFSDTLARFSDWGWWGSDAVPSGADRLVNHYAAMPSLHVAWATWSTATVCTLTGSWIARAIAASYPLLTAMVVMGTGNHYLFDVLAGVMLWMLAHGVVRYATLMRMTAIARGGRVVGSGGFARGVGGVFSRLISAAGGACSGRAGLGPLGTASDRGRPPRRRMQRARADTGAEYGR